MTRIQWSQQSHGRIVASDLRFHLRPFCDRATVACDRCDHWPPRQSQAFGQVRGCFATVATVATVAYGSSLVVLPAITPWRTPT